jgi:hypothetical protein
MEEMLTRLTFSLSSFLSQQMRERKNGGGGLVPTPSSHSSFLFLISSPRHC